MRGNCLAWECGRTPELSQVRQLHVQQLLHQAKVRALSCSLSCGVQGCCCTDICLQELKLHGDKVPRSGSTSSLRVTCVGLIPDFVMPT